MSDGLIYKKITACMKSITPIGKERVNTQQGAGFKFRGIDDIYNAIHTILADNGVFTVPQVVDVKREERQSKSGGTLNYSILTIDYKFYAEDGSFITATMVGEAMDSGDKASNKAQSVAHKYAFLQVFAIATQEDKDPDAEIHEVKASSVAKPYNDKTDNFIPDDPAKNRAAALQMRQAASGQLLSPNAEFPKCPDCGTKMFKSKFDSGPAFYCPNKKNHKKDEGYPPNYLGDDDPGLPF